MSTLGQASISTLVPRSADTSEMHNASVDEYAALKGECAQVHLPTGRVCTLPHGHKGSCLFIWPEAGYASLSHHSARQRR
jgi:hypothetical protein